MSDPLEVINVSIMGIPFNTSRMKHSTTALLARHSHAIINYHVQLILIYD